MTPLPLDECLWALHYPDLQKACFLARVCEQQPPQQCRFHSIIKSLLQVGPTCGLTALSMLLDGVPSPEELLRLARKRGYTYQGEMFSAFNLYRLICDNVPIKHSNIVNEDKQIHPRSKVLPFDCQMHEGRLDCDKVKTYLLQGACLFVPYPFQLNYFIEFSFN